MANIDDVEVKSSCEPCSIVTCCTPFPCMRQQLTTSTGGTAFIAAGGTVMQKDLAEGEKLVVDPFSLVAWDTSVNLGVRKAGGLDMMLCSGEGCCQIQAEGPGRIVVQSMSFDKFKEALIVEAEGGQKGPLGKVFGVLKVVLSLSLELQRRRNGALKTE